MQMHFRIIDVYFDNAAWGNSMRLFAHRFEPWKEICMWKRQYPIDKKRILHQLRPLVAVVALQSAIAFKIARRPPVPPTFKSSTTLLRGSVIGAQ